MASPSNNSEVTRIQSIYVCMFQFLVPQFLVFRYCTSLLASTYKQFALFNPAFPFFLLSLFFVCILQLDDHFQKPRNFFSPTQPLPLIHFRRWSPENSALSILNSMETSGPVNIHTHGVMHIQTTN